MPRIPDVLIVGNGAVGSACARSLATAGARVTVLQAPSSDGEAWTVSAGMLAAQVESGFDSPILDLGVAGRAFHARHAIRLREATGIDIGLAEGGIIELAWSPVVAEALKERISWQRQRGYRASWLDPEEVAVQWPWLGASLGAFWSPDDGAVIPEQLVAAQRADAVRRGATVVVDRALSLESSGGAVRGVTGEAGSYTAGAVIIAAGAWSGRLANLPRPVSVEPVRGHLMRFPWPTANADAIVYGDHCYLLRRGAEMIVGATVDHRGFDLTPDPVALTSLQRRAAAICPALIDAVPIDVRGGFRPGTPDGLPIIGAEPRVRGLWYATGHGRNGILLAGITGEMLARELGGDLQDELLSPFRPTRFWD